tara:strand:+ start:501 stop:908 length:408 start_codon:yes stop_codon:yes gene_type:complete
MTCALILGSIAARADQQGPKFIEVGMTANVKLSAARRDANLSGPEASGEIIWTYSEIGASPASAKPRPKPQQVPSNTRDSLGADFQTLLTEKMMVSKTLVGNRVMSQKERIEWRDCRCFIETMKLTLSKPLKNSI